MSSPFLLRHLLIVLAVAANLAVSVKVLVSWHVPDPPWLGAPLRGGTVVYAAASLMLFVATALLFVLVELLPESRACWKRRADWDAVQPGMKRDAVVALLGEPFQATSSLLDGVKEQLPYKLHALGDLEAGHVDVKADGTVASKRPEGELWAVVRDEWLPRGYGRSVLMNEVRTILGVVSIAALLALAVAALVPVGAQGSWRSFSLYTPLVALLSAALYESTRAPGWRFDSCLLVPIHAVVLGGWLVRLVGFLRS